MNIVVKLQKCGVFLARIMPLKVSDSIARFIGGLCCFFLKKKRGYILRNLYYIVPDKSAHNYLCRKTFEKFARCMVDFFRIGYLRKSDVINDVLAFGVEYLDQALTSKKGCILLTLHIGNWDYAGSYLAACGYPMNALVEETEPEMFRLYTKHREATGLKTYPLSRSAAALLDTIKNNRILAVLADRDLTGKGEKLKFFSGQRRFPANLGEIVVKRKIPVVFGYMVLSEGKKRYVGFVEPAQIFEDEKKFYRYMIDCFERTIRKYPDQWFVFHPEWIE
ncbi:MAG: lysophospholipid acyltransferase family protein [candidate division WOR-3 bacterium]|nr:lysophospholipid acyltransferase family protein [candidate division WOR-3 bacterium]